MSNRKVASRFILASLAIVVISSIAFASPWTTALSWLGFDDAPPAAETSPSAEMMTIGACDTAGPIEIEATGGSLGPVSYGSLVAAFTAINNGVHTGAISIEVCSNTTEGATATLNASGSGSASYSVIIMRPAGGAARTISGTIAGPLIDLNGADNVTINGINSGGDSLTLENSLSATTPSTIRFIGDATGNTVQNATIKGANTSTTLGTIFFSTGTTTGNDTNTITNNTITSSGSNFATNAIYSSGTSTAIDNGAIQITNNNISDFFNAASVTAGINVGATGNSGWTITGNKLFQSATRVYTTGNTHNGIFVGVGQGYTISNNTIGYADAAGSGTTNLVGNSVALTGTFPSSYTTTGTANTTRYIAINATFTAAGTVSNIQNNTIAGFALYTSSGATTTNGIWCGIQVLSGNANIGTTTGNTIGTATSSIYTAATSAGGMIAGIYATSTNTITIQNNTIQNFDAMGTTASSSGSVNGINSAGTAGNFDISGNTIGNATNPNFRMGTLTTGANLSNVGTTFGAGTGASIFQGILNSATGTVGIGTVSLPNTIRNASANSTSSSARVAGIQTSGGTNTIDSNSIYNLTTPSANTSTSSSPAVAGIHLSISSLTETITRNTIRDLSSTAATATVYVDGIYIGSTPAATISKNNIYNLTSASTSTTSSINGILLFNSSATINIYNNMMRLGLGVGNNPLIRGILDNSATSSPTNIIHNSIYIDGTQGGNTVNTACINKIVSSTMTITDNILWNNRASTGSPGTNTGRHYGIQMASAVGNPTSNYNDIYTPNNGGTVALSSGGQDLVTLANWRTSTTQDLNSQNADPKFIDATNATTPNLHINPSVTTLIEGNGILVAAPTDDFDGQTRSGLTPVDIGADAGNFIGVDVTPPAISYTALGNTTSTADRTLSITVTDATGVPTTGIGLPVIYYRKNAGSYVNTQCSFVSGSTYSCNLLSASLGGLVATDTVSYYVAAQDTAATPNVTTNPAGGASGFTANPPAASTPPTTPNSYLISTAITGTYTVDAGGPITSLTNAGGMFAQINAGVVTGNVTVNITSNLTAETGAVALNQFAEEGVGGYTITFKSSGGSARTISGTSAAGLITLNGADRVIFDGTSTVPRDSVLGNEDKSDLAPEAAGDNLTIINNNTGTSSAVIWVQTATGSNGATNNIFKNLNITGSGNTQTLFGIGFGSSTISTSSLGTSNNNNRVESCDVQKTQYGIYSQGSGPFSKNTGNVITQNSINAASPNNVQIGGIWVGFEDGVQITQNNVANINPSATTPAFGITLGTRPSNTFIVFSGNEVSGATVSGNIVDNIVRTGDGTAFGIGVATTTTTGSAANNIVNNTISRVRSTASTPSDFSVGLLLGGSSNGTTGSTKAYFNSVSATGVCSSSSPCYAAVVGGSNGVVDLRNNIFYNTQTSTSGKIYAIGFTYSTFTNLTSNNNEFFTTTASTLAETAALGSGGTDQTFASFKAATGQDANSLNSDPLFNSATNLQPQTGSPVIGTGVFGTGITTDITGATRANPPSIGAYDTALDTAGPVITYTALGNTTSTGDRTLAISASDTSGVPSSGLGLPVIYYRKNAGAYVNTQCVFVSGTNYNCDLLAASLGGLTTGDTVSYYVAAQDNLGNVSVNPSAGASGLTANPPAAGTPPTTPNSYLIAAAVSGTYVVNAGGGGAATSLTNTGGMFQQINNGVVTGNITIEIASDLTAETGTVALNQFASGFNLTIKPTGAPRTISGTGSGAILIKLNGADNVTIDGSTSGGTDRSLTLVNSNTATGTGTLFIGSIGAGAGATGNTIKNTIIKAGTIGTTSVFTFGIFVGDTTGAAAGADNDNLTIQNNQIMTARTGIQATGAVGGALDNLSITGNLIGDNTVANSIGRIGINVSTVSIANVVSNTVKNIFLSGDTSSSLGIVMSTASGANINLNTVTGISATGSSVVPTGIAVNTATTNLTISGNTVDGVSSSGSVGPQGITVGTGVINSTVSNNNVTNINYTGTSGYGGKGIEINTGSASSAALVSNNFVSNIKGDCWSPGANILDTAMGIRVTGSTGGVSIYNNSVNLGSGSFAGNSQSGTISAALYIASTATALNIRNNILTNNLNNTTITNDKNYAFYSDAANTAFTDINYNDYWVPASTAAGPQVLGFLTSDRLTIGDIQTATGKDAQSISGDPLFASATDLHIASGSPARNTGTTIGTVLQDYDLDARPKEGVYEIGADEYVDSIAPDTQIDSNPTNPSNSSSATFTFSGTDSLAPEAVASFECDLDGSGYFACTSPRTFNSLSDGSHTFVVRAKDAGGNFDPTPASYTWVIDTTPPTIIPDPPFIASYTNSTSATFTFHGADGGSGIAGFICSLDGAAFTSCSSPVTYNSLSVGVHTFDAKSVDNAGNQSVANYSAVWEIDQTPPDTFIDSNPPDPSSSSSATFTFHGTDTPVSPPNPFGPGLTYECSLDGAAFTSCTSPVNYSGLSQGSHTFQVRTIDRATNPDPSPASYTWSYTIPTYSGTIPVGTGETITSLTNAGGVFDLFNNGQIGGNVTVSLTSDLTAETGAFALNQQSETAPGGYTITIQSSAAVQRTISGTGPASGALINLNGADRVKFDGGTFAAPLLLIRDMNTGGGSAVIRLRNGATFNTIKDCVIEGSTNSLINLATGGSGQYDNLILENRMHDRTDAVANRPDYGVLSNSVNPILNGRNTIQANVIVDFLTAGIFANSNNPTSEGWTIKDNDIYKTPGATPLSSTGISVGGVISGPTPTVISGNKIHGLTATTTSSCTGIRLDLVQGTTVSNNVIYDMQTTSGATGNIFGIFYAGRFSFATDVTLINNMITIAPTLTTSQPITGILDFGLAGNSFTAYNNTVYIGGTASGAVTSWAFRRGASSPTTHVERNNIAFNARTGSTLPNYAAGDASANTGTFDSNYNMFVGIGAPGLEDNYFDYGTANVGTPVSVATWKAGPPARDANSVFSRSDATTAAANFVDVSTGNLRLVYSALAKNAGTTVAAVTTDIDGDTRPRDGAYDIGADEYTDGNAPTVMILTNPSNPSNSSSATFTFSGSDTLAPEQIAQFECQIDGGGYSTCTSPQTYNSLTDGSHTFQVRAKDNSGNTGPPASYTWVIDTAAPDTIIDTFPVNPTNNTSAMFTFHGIDNAGGSGVSGFDCQVDGQGYNPCNSGTLNLSGLNNFNHTVDIRARDAAGSVDSTPASYTWLVDTVPPVTTIDTFPSNPANSTSATFTFHATDPIPASGVAGFSCQIDAGGFTPCSSGVNYTLGQGTHVFDVRAIDNAGNSNPAVQTYTWTIDLTNPVIAPYTPIPATSQVTPRNLLVTVTDNLAIGSVNIFYAVNGGSYSSAACTLSGGPPNEYSCSIPGQVSGTSVAYYVAAADTATNSATAPSSAEPNQYTVGIATIPGGTYANARFTSGSSLSGNVVITENVNLSGIITTGANVLHLDCDATVTGVGVSSYVDGNVQKDFCATSATFTFPVGTTPDGLRPEEIVPEGNPGEYSPMTATITAGTFPSSLTVSAEDDFLQGLTQTSAVSRHWNVTETGDLTVNMTFNYLDQDINGNEANYKVFKRTTFTTEVSPNSNNPAANQATVNNVSSFSKWGIGAVAPTAATVSVSGRVMTASGNGIRNAMVIISGNSLPQARTVQTGAFGYYLFDGLQAGETYVIQVGAKRFRFAVPSRVINVQDSIGDIDFVANPQE